MVGWMDDEYNFEIPENLKTSGFKSGVFLKCGFMVKLVSV